MGVGSTVTKVLRRHVRIVIYPLLCIKGGSNVSTAASRISVEYGTTRETLPVLTLDVIISARNNSLHWESYSRVVVTKVHL